MHDGCSGSFTDGKQVIEKLKMMGFDQQYMPLPATLNCECGETLTMDTFVYKCPHCGMHYAVTPCHAFDASNIMKAGKDID